jgi:DNA-binding MarR family transcriptional regulator
MDRLADVGSGDEGTGLGQAIDAIERALVRIRRTQTRRTLGRQASGGSGHSVGVNIAGAVDAVDEGPPSPGREVTVGTVAERLAVDPSRASRIVASAVQSGYLHRVASQTDGRRIHLELTPAGHDLMETIRQYRQDYFARLLHDWPGQDRDELARLLTKLAGALADPRQN